MRIRYIVIGFVSLLIVLLATVNHTLNVNHADVRPLDKDNSVPYVTSAERGSYSAPSSSRTVSKLPWENDQDFQKALDANKADVQMANYCTVLIDPIPGEETNVHIAARLLKGIVVQPGRTFSQNESIGPYNQSKGFQMGPVYIGSQLKSTIGGGVCKIASTLYNVAVLSNLPIIERYAHSMPVPYVPLGQDATVCYGVKDIKFLNNTPFPILIWAEGIDNRLYIAFYGQTVPPNVEWHHEILKKIETYKIYRNNYMAERGNEKVIVEGMDGAIVRSWLTIKIPGKKDTITKKLGKDYYNPMPAIVEQGMLTPNPASVR
ncbi:MAG TPA: VanW family protein [Syntrophomonadaceae bacterium]|nr:VanW family protein [Syntrophomonadaceae bacterium]